LKQQHGEQKLNRHAVTLPRLPAMLL